MPAIAQDVRLNVFDCNEDSLYLIYKAGGEDEFWARRKAENQAYGLRKLRDEVQAMRPDQRDVFFAIYDPGEEGSERSALMCALQQAPRTRNTDRTFCDGQRRHMDKMNDYNREKILKAAKKAGINTHGKFFNGIGRYTDPDAWSSNQQDVIDAAKRKRLKLEGPTECNYMREDLPPPKPKKLAEDLVKNEALSLMRQDPALAEKVRKSPKAKQELRERIQATHSRQ